MPKYHPQANPVERMNRVIKAMLRSYIKTTQRKGDEYLADFRFAFNTAQHFSIQTFPAFLNLGRPPSGTVLATLTSEVGQPSASRNVDAWKERMTLLESIRDLVKLHLEKAQRKQAHHYNLRRRPYSFKIGDKVLQKDRTLSSAQKGVTASLLPTYNPEIFTISKIISENVYELADGNGKVQSLSIHSKDLKPFNTEP